MKTLSDNWYAYPRYYDLAFRADTKLEADFIEAAWRKFGRPDSRTILEPGCGSGRLVVELAKRGYHVTAFDLCRESIAYLDGQLKRRKLNANTFVGDMTEFQLSGPVDLAFNFCNTFRHLLTEEAARSHLQSVAGSLEPGGIYLLGLHVMPPDADPDDCERWRESYRGTTVTCTFKVLSTDEVGRLETLRTILSARGPGVSFRVRTDYPMRLYTSGELLDLVNSVPEFELCEVYDFWYDINFSRELDDEISDTVLVLRKRTAMPNRR
ncbi:MAG: class I SAM-dependent methyltransferase [Planctomycetota bacterium]